LREKGEKGDFNKKGKFLKVTATFEGIAVAKQEICETLSILAVLVYTDQIDLRC
jgi:hypothetical protein